ncbi:MAG: F0F1 ATP synthase subunit B [candidate division Zixibacteria bacterium]|nr:F0F1 ATP synthase subunit B [candidate division Zixibacteria bacterium]
MNLDWQLVLTHIVGFLITVWILKKFAWKPLLGVLEKRRQTIAAEFEKSQKAQDEAARIAKEYYEQLSHIKEEAQRALNTAVNEGREAAEEIRQQGQREAHEIIERAKGQLELEVDKARVTLKEEIVDMTLAATEKVIRTKLDEAEHRRLISDFIDGVKKS